MDAKTRDKTHQRGLVVILAIDPGASGGIAYKLPDSTAACFPMPETDGDLADELDELLHQLPAATCYLEDLVKFAGRNMPSSAMAVYARNFGYIEGLLTGLNVKIIRVKPQEWQKGLGLGTSRGGTKTEWKNKLKGEAQRLFPHLRRQITLKTSDALLILEYGMRKAKA